MLKRRTFLAGAGAAFALRAVPSVQATSENEGRRLVAQTDRTRILRGAKMALAHAPFTITSIRSPRSPGGPHDFFSEADYFWPNPRNPDGPYINRDGQSNPNNFNGHRKAMVDLSLWVPALTAAWVLTGDPRYARHAVDHLRAWFATPATRMNPNLEYAQGIHGVTTGRNYGIIDTLHLVEVARAGTVLNSALAEADRDGIHTWFREYLRWLKTSEKGQQERDTSNNHATCWALQTSEYARLLGDEAARNEERQWFVRTLLGDQMAEDALTALVLSIFGLLSVQSDTERQRRRELAVRIALGAQRRHIFILTIKEIGQLAFAGILIGTLVSAAALRVFTSELSTIGSPPFQVWLLAPILSMLMLIMTATVAGYRALSGEPQSVMREEG